MALRRDMGRAPLLGVTKGIRIPIASVTGASPPRSGACCFLNNHAILPIYICEPFNYLWSLEPIDLLEGACMNFSNAQRWRSLSPILSDLLDLDVRKRERVLNHLRDGDASLAEDLEMLLAHANQVKSEHFLETPVCNILDGMVDKPGHAGSTLAPRQNS